MQGLFYARRYDAVTIPAITLVDYCERAGQGVWSEPLNALSNLAFLLATLLVVLRCRRRSGCPAAVYLLAWLTVAVGIASFLWHTLAQSWMQWLDVMAIALFIVAYLVTYTLRRAGRWQAAIAVLVWLLLNGLMLLLFPGGALNGSIYYLPTLLLLIGLLFLARGDRPLLLVMVGLFVLSLLLRTLDAELCELFPAGTHFGWHLVNALVLYLAMRTMTD